MGGTGRERVRERGNWAICLTGSNEIKVVDRSIHQTFHKVWRVSLTILCYWANCIRRWCVWPASSRNTNSDGRTWWGVVAVPGWSSRWAPRGTRGRRWWPTTVVAEDRDGALDTLLCVLILGYLLLPTFCCCFFFFFCCFLFTSRATDTNDRGNKRDENNKNNPHAQRCNKSNHYRLQLA